MLRLLRKTCSAYVESFRGLPRDVWIISIVLLVNRSGTMVLPFLALYCRKELEFSYTTTGTLLTLYGFGSIIGSYLGGKACVRLGTATTLKLSLFISVIAYLLVRFSSTFATLAASLLFLSIVAEAFRPAATTATTQAVPPALHPRALALSRLAVNLGMSLGPALGGFLALQNYHLLFYVDGGTCLLAGLFLVFFFRPHPFHEEEGTETAEAPARSPFRDGRYLASLLMMLPISLIFFQMLATYPLYLNEQRGFLESEIGLVFAVNTVVIVLFEMILVRKVESWSLLRTVGFGAFLCALGFGLTPWARNHVLLVGTVLIWTVGEMLTMPLTAAYAARRSTTKNRGSYMGLYSGSFSVAFVIAPSLGTAVYERNPDLMWYGSLVAGVIVWVGFVWLSRGETGDTGSTNK